MKVETECPKEDPNTAKRRKAKGAAEAEGRESPSMLREMGFDEFIQMIFYRKSFFLYNIIFH